VSSGAAQLFRLSLPPSLQLASTALDAAALAAMELHAATALAPAPASACASLSAGGGVGVAYVSDPLVGRHCLRLRGDGSLEVAAVQNPTLSFAPPSLSSSSPSPLSSSSLSSSSPSSDAGLGSLLDPLLAECARRLAAVKSSLSLGTTPAGGPQQGQPPPLLLDAAGFQRFQKWEGKAVKLAASLSELKLHLIGSAEDAGARVREQEHAQAQLMEDVTGVC
jgi:hypothetical protein